MTVKRPRAPLLANWSKSSDDNAHSVDAGRSANALAGVLARMFLGGRRPRQPLR